MLKFLYKSLMLIAILGFVGCEADVDQFNPNDDSVYHKTDVFGLVTSRSGQAIEGATVKFEGRQVITDQFGVYQFNDVEVNSRHSFINIKKDGYFESTRTFRANSAGTQTQRTQLIEKVFDQSFSNASGGTITKGTTTLAFKSNSIVYDSDKSDYNGNVQVAMHYLDPTLPQLDQQMPGDLTAIDLESNYMALTTYGMVYVELQDPSGNKLQIKNGEKVEMMAEVPFELLSEAPATIKMWYFDEGIGLWKEEGSATLDGNVYVGEVGHFSCWNYDDNAPAITLSGRVIDTNGDPLSGVHVWVARPGNFGGGHGNTNPDGTFSGGVSKDEVLTFSIYDAQTCNFNTPIYSTTIGPFSVDTDLGDITVDLSVLGSIHVTATVLDCQDQPVTNGFARIHGTEILITNGVVDAMIPICNVNTTLTFVAIDINGQEQSSVYTVTGPATDLGVINACGVQFDFVEIKCTALSVDVTALQEIGLYSSQDSIKGFYAYVNDNSIDIAFDDMNAGDYIEGTFDIIEANVFTSSLNQTDLVLENGTVTITQYVPSEDYLRGNYTIEVIDPGTSNLYTFFGDFKLTTF